MDNQTILFVVAGMLFVIAVSSFWDNKDAPKDFFEKNSSEIPKGKTDELSDDNKESASASDSDVVVYFKRDDIEYFMEILEEIKADAENTDKEISFQVKINGKRISVVIGSEKEQKND